MSVSDFLTFVPSCSMRLRSAATLLSLSLVPSASGAWDFGWSVPSTSSMAPGCTTAELQKLSILGRSAMRCFDIYIPEMIGYLRSMTKEETNWLNLCSEDMNRYQEECYKWLEAMTQMAIQQQNSVPGKAANNLFANPPKVANCLAGIQQGPSVGAFGTACTDGLYLQYMLDTAKTWAPYLNAVQPWHMPPQLQGCSAPDLLNIQESYLPVMDCMHVNLSQVMAAFSTPDNGQTQLEDATIRAAVDCLYDPHFSNHQCMYLAVQFSTMQWGSWDSFNLTTLLQALTDFPQACRCTKGISTSPSYNAVSSKCPAHELLSVLGTMESTCKWEGPVTKGLNITMTGCRQADIIRSELVGMQVMDCMGAKPSDLQGSTTNLDNSRIGSVVNCALHPSYNNPDCLDLLASLPTIAQSNPQSLEARLFDSLTSNGSAFCTCADAAFKSAPAQAIPPTCSVPYSVNRFMRNNYKTCNALSKIPSSKWTLIATIIAREFSS